MDALLHDLRYAARHLRRAPGFAAAAILTLALGIGANTAMFTVLNTLVIQRLPIQDPDGLISVSGRNARGGPRSIPISAVRTERVLSVRIQPIPGGYRGLDAGPYYAALLEKLAVLPGVQSVGATRMFPRQSTTPIAGANRVRG